MLHHQKNSWKIVLQAKLIRREYEYVFLLLEEELNFSNSENKFIACLFIKQRDPAYLSIDNNSTSKMSVSFGPICGLGLLSP